MSGPDDYSFRYWGDIDVVRGTMLEKYAYVRQDVKAAMQRLWDKPGIGSATHLMRWDYSTVEINGLPAHVTWRGLGKKVPTP